MQPEIKQRLEQLLKSGPQRIHLIGVCGSGMSGLARLLLAQGHERFRFRSGSGGAMPPIICRTGVRYFEGHAASNVDGAALVVFSSAIAAENPERVAAAEHGHPLRAPRGMPRRSRRCQERLRRRGQPRQDDHLVDAHPRPAPGRPESLALHRRAGAAARRERGVDRGQAVRGRGRRKRRHAGALRAAGEPHPQHRGGASRFLSRHRGDRAGLRHAVRADAAARSFIAPTTRTRCCSARTRSRR